MFCPKCGLQNADETKFCRGCGAELTNVLAVVDGKLSGTRALSEKYIELSSRGIRGVLMGLGFLIVSGAAFGISIRTAVLGLFALAFASVFLGTGISRLVQASRIKALTEKDEPAALPPDQTGYIKPSRSNYQTDDLDAQPLSVTEHTTTNLQMDSDSENRTLPKK